MCIQGSCGAKHSALVLTDGKKTSLYMTGEGGKGQLGTGRYQSEVNYVKILDKVLHVACGYEHTMIINNDYKLMATGCNAEGQLGIRERNKLCVPSLVSIEEVVKVDASNATACITAQGHLYVWGKGIYSPRQVGVGVVFSEASLGNGFGMFVDAEKKVFGWGCSEYGEVNGECGEDIVRIVNLDGKAVEKVECGYGFCIGIRKKGGNSREVRNKSARVRNVSQDISRKGLAKTHRIAENRGSTRKSCDFEGNSKENKTRVSDLVEMNEKINSKDRECEKLKFCLEKEQNKNSRLEKEAENDKLIIQSLESEVNEYKNNLKSVYEYTNQSAGSISILEQRNIDQQRVIEKQANEILALSKENKKLKAYVSEESSAGKVLRSENEALANKVKLLEQNLQNLSSNKGEILAKLNVIAYENDRLRIQNSELESANSHLSKQIEVQISNHVKEYKEKTLERLNAPVSPNSPKSVSPIKKQNGANPITPTKESIKLKIAALQHNRAVIEARMKELNTE